MNYELQIFKTNILSVLNAHRPFSCDFLNNANNHCFHSICIQFTSHLEMIYSLQEMC